MSNCFASSKLRIVGITATNNGISLENNENFIPRFGSHKNHAPLSALSICKTPLLYAS